MTGFCFFLHFDAMEGHPWLPTQMETGEAADAKNTDETWARRSETREVSHAG